MGLTDRAARALTDPRRKASCRHSLKTILRQRVYAFALGYEDPNDHDELRSDPLPHTAMDADEQLSGASTLCRFEQGRGRARRVIVKAQHSLRGANPRYIVTSLKGAPPRPNRSPDKCAATPLPVRANPPGDALAPCPPFAAASGEYRAKIDPRTPETNSNGGSVHALSRQCLGRPGRPRNPERPGNARRRSGDGHEPGV